MAMKLYEVIQLVSKDQRVCSVTKVDVSGNMWSKWCRDPWYEAHDTTLEDYTAYWVVNYDGPEVVPGTCARSILLDRYVKFGLPPKFGVVEEQKLWNPHHGAAAREWIGYYVEIRNDEFWDGKSTWDIWSVWTWTPTQGWDWKLKTLSMDEASGYRQKLIREAWAA